MGFQLPIGENTEGVRVGKTDLRIRPTNQGQLFLVDHLTRRNFDLLTLTLDELRALHVKAGEILKDPGKCLDCNGTGWFTIEETKSIARYDESGRLIEPSPIRRPCGYCHKGRVK